MQFDEAGVRRRGGAVAACLVALACALAVPAAAGAYTVDSTVDDVDSAVGDEICLTGGGKCTLRAAIQESNASAGEIDQIKFDEALFDGEAADTIVLGSGLPTITDRAGLRGRHCPRAAGIEGPCVGIAAPGNSKALTVEANNVIVEGLAITGAEIAIQVNGSTTFRAIRNWLGVGLDGVPTGNGTGIAIEPGSGKARIGSPAAESEGNVFAANSAVGLDLFGAGGARIHGNYFGVEPDGTTPAPNGTDIEVTACLPGAGCGEETPAASNEIGTRIDAAGVASGGCDHGCNVISGAAESGIDLQGDGGEEGPATTTTIVGNYIGLDASGSAGIPNEEGGIVVGGAAQTVVGGADPGDANRIAGGDVALAAGPEADDLVVRGNSIGVDPNGQAALAPPDEGITVDSDGVGGVALEAVIAANEIRMEGGVGIANEGFGAWIVGNSVTGAGTGVRVLGETAEHGSLIEGNAVRVPSGDGILVESNLNRVLGNEVSGAGKAGIAIRDESSFGITSNAIGGDSPAEENLISGSGGAAVEILNREKTVNEVARNRGTGNAGSFIELVAVSPTTESTPNFGKAPPAFGTATQTGATGAAEPGARVRVFRKQGPAAGEVDSFLGEGVADSEGGWNVTYGEAVPAGTIVAATQTWEGGTTELAVTTTAGAAGDGGGGSGGTGAVSDRFRPRTVVLKGPERKSTSHRARFVFAADEPGSTFECRLDGNRFRLCRPPKTYRGVGAGNHSFEVRAVDPAGNVDRSPARWKFRVVGPR